MTGNENNSTTSAFRKQYLAYIASGTWATKRRTRLEADNNRCQGCGSTDDLHVHHKTYERFGGAERMDDLVTVCEPCHNIIHKLCRDKRQLLSETDRILKIIRADGRGPRPRKHQSRQAPDRRDVARDAKQRESAEPARPVAGMSAKKARRIGAFAMSDEERARRLAEIIAKHADNPCL